MPRPLSFDPQHKLQQAMTVFLKNGFNQTSVSDLITHLEINKFSLYKQFGNKQALFQTVLTHYTDTVFSPLISPLEKPQKGKNAINAYLKGFAIQLSKPSAQDGCLLMNTISESEKLPEPLRLNALFQLRRLKAAITENFNAAKEQGELSKDVESCVNFTLMCIQALLITRKTQGKEALLKNAEFFRETVNDW